MILRAKARLASLCGARYIRRLTMASAARSLLRSSLRPSLLLAASLALVAACTGNREQNYGHAKQHDAHADAKNAHGPAHDQKHGAQRGPAHNQGQGHGADVKKAHGIAAQAQGSPPASMPALPSEPSPDIVYDPGFEGAPVATRKTESGMLIEDFVIGTGEELAKGYKAKIAYTGHLTDGTVFDSSVRKGRPPHSFEVGKGRVIKGWDEGVIGMKVGGKRRLVIPPELGYKSRRAGRIPPNSTLVFTLELVGFMPPLPDPQPQSAYEGAPVNRNKLDNGLEIIEYKVGNGAVAKAGDTVHVHYRGTLTKDGTEFDASAKRKRPITFPLGKGRVIKGWDQGIEGMKVGGLRKLLIPAALGYGERAKGKIPANADLTFTVELMAVEPGTATPKPATPKPAH